MKTTNFQLRKTLAERVEAMEEVTGLDPKQLGALAVGRGILGSNPWAATIVGVKESMVRTANRVKRSRYGFN